MSKKIRRGLLLATLIVLMCSITRETQALANPASVNCIEKGGSLMIAKRGDKGAYGICLFPNAKQCEEWSMFRGDCPIGGIAIPELLTSEEIYCLITGGIILDDVPQCQLPTGKICSLKEFYFGECPQKIL